MYIELVSKYSKKTSHSITFSPQPYILVYYPPPPGHFPHYRLLAVAAHQAVLGGGLPAGPAGHLLPVAVLLGGAHVQRHGALPRLGALGRLGPSGGLRSAGADLYGNLWT